MTYTISLFIALENSTSSEEMTAQILPIVDNQWQGKSLTVSLLISVLRATDL